MAPLDPSGQSLLRSLSPLPFINSRNEENADPKYKKYSVNIDRELAKWDKNEEWADYISFLSKLHKAVKSYTFPSIPHSSLIAVRLGQCLQPDLPSGVHQKALELYNTIFTILGENLSLEIDTWIPGLTPLMPYASINVKPVLIDLLQTHILPLKSLRHLVLPLLYSLLPGIDDESNESFDAVLKLLDDIKARVKDDSHFWQCFFLVIINSSDRRLGALIWANRRLPKFNSTLSSNSDPPTDKSTAFQALSYEAQTTIIPESGLLIRAFCKGLEDDQLLVQRGFLELLVKNIELHSPALQFVTSPNDLELLILSACSTVLRRDMSLNRRLWNWLLGPDTSTEISSGTNINREAYFIQYGRDSLVNGLLNLINNDAENVAERCRPYRICLSVMDRWEIGVNVIPNVFTPIIKSVKKCESESDEQYYTEVLRSAGAFFDGVETITIWSDCVKLIQQKTDESLALLMFILQSFNVEEEEMIVQQLPLILILLVITDVPTPSVSSKLQLIQLLLDLIPDRAFLPLFITPDDSALGDNKLQDDAFVTDQITKYYQSSPDEADKFPFSSAEITKILQFNINKLVIQYISEKNYDMTGQFAVFLSQFLQKIHHHESKWRDDSLVTALQTLSLDENYNYKFVSDINNLFITIVDGLTTREVENFLTSIISIIWRSLITTSGTREVEAVKSLWQLQETLKDRRVEACIASLFVSTDYSPEDRGRALGALWNHSSERSNAEVILNRCIFLALEDLRKPSSLEYLVAKHWIEQVVASGSVNRLLSFITTPILNTQFIHREKPEFSEEDDLEAFSYYCETLLSVIRAHPHLKRVFVREFIPMEHSFAFVVYNENLKGKDSTYAILVKHAILRLFSFEIPSHASDSSLFSTYESILSVCLDLLSILVDKDLEDILEIGDALMHLLKKFNRRTNAKNLSEIRIIDLLSQLLKSLNDLGPSQKNQSGSGIDAGMQLDSEAEQKDPTSLRLEGLSKDLVNCLIDGFSSNYDLYVVEAWTSLLADCVPLFGEVILQVLLPLVESLATQISSKFDIIRATYSSDACDFVASNEYPVALSVLFSYIKALEKLLAAAHGQLTSNTATRGTAGKPVAEPGFFGAVMSGVFTVESPLARSTAANNRLTVLLSFQDAIHECFGIWTWVEENSSLKSKPGNSQKSQKMDSHMYHSARLKFWTRKLMESLYLMETMETLEMFIEIGKSSPYIFKVLHGLDGSKPKSTIPHLFNSLISRVNPSNVDLKERSTLTSDLTDYDMMAFLVDYLNSLENDAVEDIWFESIGFLREVQTNNALYRHLMPGVFRFISVLATKVDTLSFGEQRRIRRDLSDVFSKLFNIVLSSRAIVAASDSGAASADPEKEKTDQPETLGSPENDSSLNLASQVQAGKAGNLLHENLAVALIDVVPSLGLILNDSDKVNTSLSTIVANFIVPAAKSKAFPNSFSPRLTQLLLTLISQPGSQKAWRSYVGDIIFDQRFMGMNPGQSDKWKEITQKWANADKDRLQDYISRLLSHGSNSNVLFGWSDQEATYTHRNINRLSFIFLSGTSDAYLLNIKNVIEKLDEIMSSETVADTLRSEVFTCLRAIILKVDPTHLSTIWTFVYSELYKTFTMVFSIYSSGEVSVENLAKKKVFLKGLVAACKLLDMLLVLGLEDFNPHEWIFICDSIDAIFKDADHPSTGVVDKIASSGSLSIPGSSYEHKQDRSKKRRPFLTGVGPITSISQLRPFFDNISIYNYEAMYSLASPDLAACEQEIMQDIFDFTQA